MTKLGIIAAMDNEITVLCKTMQHNSESYSITEINNLKFYFGTLNNTSVVLVKSGVGKVNAAICTQLLITVFHVESIINTGIAGAISPELSVFDFVVSSDVVHHDADAIAFGYPPNTIPGLPTFFIADKALISQAVNSFSESNLPGKIFIGRIASGDQFIGNIEAKEKIKASCNPFCVEMEGAAIAQTCILNNKPFVIIRCISDLADKSTDKFNEDEAAHRSSELILHFLK